MNINNIQGFNAYNYAKKITENAQDSGGGFKDLVATAAKTAINTVKDGEAASMNAIAGKASLAEVVTAVNSADIALKTMVSIRDKVINAYQDILKMPI